MKIIKLALIVAVAYFGYNQYQESFAATTPLSGDWKSNKSLTMKELYKQGLTQKQEAFFKKILGDMTISISSKNWESTLHGESTSETYEILSESNGCYQVQFGSGKSQKVCMLNGNLNISSPSGLVTNFRYNEVFSPL